MNKPRVCFVSESETTYSLLVGAPAEKMGGAELQQVLLANALVEAGYEVSFVVPDFGQRDGEKTSCGITILIGGKRPDASGLTSVLEGVRALFAALKKSGADVYYQRTSAAVTGVIALYCKLHRKPFVFSVAHDLDISGPIGLYMNPRYLWIYRFGLRNAAAVVVQTEHQLRLLKENVGQDGVVIRSTFERPAENESYSDRRSILWVGSFRSVKRPEMFVELARRLPQFRFVMMGGRASNQSALYDDICRDANELTNLELTGSVTYGDSGRYFGEAFLFVNTSSSEGFPNTYLQSWCRGTPVLATFDPDGVIEKFGLGQHCPGIDELETAVLRFMGDNELRESAARRGVEYVNKHHRPDVVAAEYDSLFVSLCK